MKRMNLKRWGRFFSILFTSLFICMLVGTSLISSKQQLEQTQMERLVLTKTNKLQEVLSKLLYKTQTLSVLVLQDNGEIKDFDQIAATVLDDPAIRNILIAPDGVVSNVYPLAGNEAVIGFDYFAEGEGNREAVLARDEGQLILGGPFNLVQGGQAIVGRLPVYIGNRMDEKNFWGIVSVTLNYPQALEGAALMDLENQGYAYEIWRVSPDTGERQVIASSPYDYSSGARYVEKPIELFNATWYFRIAPIREWYQYPEAWICIFLGLFVSFLLAMLFLHNYDLHKVKRDLECMAEMDALTGVLNRRGLFHILEELMQDKKQKLILSYIDLNKFKEINDNYGHNTGDKVLQHFAEIMVKCAGANELAARIGGDEFILILRNTDDCKYAEQLFEKIQEELKVPVPVSREESIRISISFGLAYYPKDGKNIDELIGAADDKMYAGKRRILEEGLPVRLK